MSPAQNNEHTSETTKSQNEKTLRYGMIVLSLLALVTFVSVIAPRALSFLPGLLALIGLGVRYFYVREKTSWPKTLLLITGSICALSLLSALWAIDPAMAIRRTFKTAAVIIPAAFLVRLALDMPEQALRKYTPYIPFAFFAGMALISLEYLAGMPLYHIIHNIPFDQKVQLHVYNRGASVLAVLFIASFFTLQSCANKQKTLLSAAAILVTIPFFVITASQSAQLAIICGVIIAFLFPYGKKWAWMILQAGLVSLTLLAPWIAIWLFHNYADSIHALPHMGGGDQGASAGNRLEVWDYISRYALQNPLYGFGVEATRSVKEFDSAEIFQRGKTILHPHNFALQAWIEFGLIGAISTCALVIYSLQKIQKDFQYGSQRIFLPTFCMLVSIGATGYGVWQGWWLGLILMAVAYTVICARYDQLSKESRQDNRAQV